MLPLRPLLQDARQVIPSPPNRGRRSDIELPDQQNHAQSRGRAQCPSGNVCGLFEAGRADMVVRTYVDVLQAISHRSLQ